MATKIEWVKNEDGTKGETWNPVRGCKPISPGCANCYAARMATRFAGHLGAYDGLASKGKWTGKIGVVNDDIRKPWRWRKPRRVFVCSMSDLFYDKVPDSVIADVFWTMAHARQHTFIVLTKRAKRMRDFCKTLSPHHGVLENVWMGVTVENQLAADARLPYLAETPAARRFVSVEPILEKVQLNLSAYAGEIHWVICGCESGPGKRDFSYDWARGLRDECVRADVPFFFKQAPTRGKIDKMPILDRKVWDQMPKGVAWQA